MGFLNIQCERLRSNETINDCDLGPDDFQLETQSIVKHVLVACVNGFLVARGQCLGT